MAVHKRPALALRDLLAVVVVATLVLVFGPASLAQLRGNGRVGTCGEHLRTIGFMTKIYANDNGEHWMIPPFRHQAVDNEGIDYLAGDRINDPPSDPGEVGYERETESTSETPPDPDGGSTAVSVTRAYWLLVRSGDLTTEQFICPASRDTPDPAVVPDWYYDFTGYDHISYGYQVPFSPRGNRPREGMNSRMVLAADKGPYYLNTFTPTFRAPRRQLLTLDHRDAFWRVYNSPNHHGRGQNVLFADARVELARTPTVGVHGDNIYTVMTDAWDATGFNRIHGNSPHYSPVAAYPYPGQDVFGPGVYSSTDSLIYP